MKDTIIDFTPEMLNELCKKEPRFKQVLKGYNGPVVSFECDGFGPMLLPNNKRIIDTVAICWAFVTFGHRGSTQFNQVVAKEVAKRMNGKVYSVKTLANLVGM